MTPTVLHPMDFYLHLDQAVGKVLVLFLAPRCGGCKRLLHLLAQEVELSVPCVQVNAEDAGFLLEEYSIRHLPTVLCFEGGECIGEVESLGSVSALLEAAEAL